MQTKTQGIIDAFEAVTKNDQSQSYCNKWLTNSNVVSIINLEYGLNVGLLTTKNLNRAVLTKFPSCELGDGHDYGGVHVQERLEIWQRK